MQLFACLDGNFGVARAKECMLCPLSQKVLELYPYDTPDPADSLRGPDCAAVLRALACRFSLDISDVEAGHASTRRITSVKSVQVHKPQLTSVSADWALGLNLISRSEIVGAREEASLTEQNDGFEGDGDDGDEENCQRSKPKQHRANPWCAFLSEHCKASFNSAGLDMAGLRAKFRALSSEEKERCRRMAHLAKLAVERGLKHPYGDPGEGQRSRQLLPSAASNSSSHLAIATTGIESDVNACLQIVRTEQKEQQMQLRQRMTSVEQTIAEYREDDSHISEILEDFPTMLAASRPPLVGFKG